MHFIKMGAPILKSDSDVGHGEMTKYRVRPGYGSSKLLVEFLSDSTDKQFLDDLRTVFSTNGVKAKQTENLVFLSRTELDSPAGRFTVDHDEWSMVWVFADNNQDAIHFVDRILSGSGKFRKVEVDFKEYAQQDKCSVRGKPRR